MIFEGRWTYTRCVSFRPVQLDLETALQELTKLGGPDASEQKRICGEMQKVIADLADAISHKDHRAEPEYEETTVKPFSNLCLQGPTSKPAAE